MKKLLFIFVVLLFACESEERYCFDCRRDIFTPDGSYSMEQWREVLAPYSLGYRIKLLAQLFTRRFSEQLAPYEITPFHWVVLCCLWEEDGLPTSVLGSRLQQVGGTLTGVLDRMEKRGLVERKRDPNDRRVWRIWLTDAGRELRETLPPIALTLREDLLQGVTQEERQLLSRVIDQVIANLNR